MEVAAVLAALALAVILGALSQRLCGMGLGLIAVPVFVALTGPVLGVLTVNIAAFVVGLAVAWSLRVDICWRRWRVIAAWAIIGTVPGWALVTWLDTALLELLIGVSLLASLAVSVFVGSVVVPWPRLALRASGFVGGILNTSVGQAAPVMVLYQRATGWDQRTFQATLQPSFLVMNAASILAKGFATSIPPVPVRPALYVGVISVAAVVGVGAGQVCSRYVSARVAKRWAFAVATLGALLTFGRGLVGVL